MYYVNFGTLTKNNTGSNNTATPAYASNHFNSHFTLTPLAASDGLGSAQWGGWTRKIPRVISFCLHKSGCNSLYTDLPRSCHQLIIYTGYERLRYAVFCKHTRAFLAPCHCILQKATPERWKQLWNGV